MWSPLGEGSHARHQSQLKPFTLHGGDRARPTSLGLISLSLSHLSVSRQGVLQRQFRACSLSGFTLALWPCWTGLLVPL